MLIPVKIHRFIQTLLDFSVGVENECIRSSKMDNWDPVRIKNAVALSQTHNSRGTRVSQSWRATASVRWSEVDTF